MLEGDKSMPTAQNISIPQSHAARTSPRMSVSRPNTELHQLAVDPEQTPTADFGEQSFTENPSFINDHSNRNRVGQSHGLQDSLGGQGIHNSQFEPRRKKKLLPRYATESSDAMGLKSGEMKKERSQPLQATNQNTPANIIAPQESSTTGQFLQDGSGDNFVSRYSSQTAKRPQTNQEAKIIDDLEGLLAAINLQDDNKFTIGAQQFKISQRFKALLENQLDNVDQTPVSFRPDKSPAANNSDMFIPDERQRQDKERLGKIVSMTDNFLIQGQESEKIPLLEKMASKQTDVKLPMAEIKSIKTVHDEEEQLEDLGTIKHSIKRSMTTQSNIQTLDKNEQFLLSGKINSGQSIISEYIELEHNFSDLKIIRQDMQPLSTNSNKQAETKQSQPISPIEKRIQTQETLPENDEDDEYAKIMKQLQQEIDAQKLPPKEKATEEPEIKKPSMPVIGSKTQDLGFADLPLPPLPKGKAEPHTLLDEFLLPPLPNGKTNNQGLLVGFDLPPVPSGNTKNNPLINQFTPTVVQEQGELPVKGMEMNDSAPSTIAKQISEEKKSSAQSLREIVAKRSDILTSPARQTAEFGSLASEATKNQIQRTATENSQSFQTDYFIPSKQRDVIIKKTVSIETATPRDDHQNQLQAIAEKEEQDTSEFRDDVSNVSNALSAMIGQKQHLNISQSMDIEPPIDTGNQIIDFVTKLCYNIGMSSDIFVGKNQEILNDVLFIRADDQHQDVKEIRKQIKEILSLSKAHQQQRSSSSKDLYGKKTFTGYMNRSTQSLGFFSPKNNNAQPSDILDELQFQLQMNKLQLAVMSYYLKNKVAKNEREKRGHFQSVERKRQQLEYQVKKILDRFRKEDKKVHLAFLFASPLVLSSGGESTTNDHRYKLMPQLNFTKEFIKIKESINSAQVQLTITKRQCTNKSLGEVLSQQPLGIHFSGHGLLNTKEEIGEELANIYKDQGDLLLLETEEGDSQLVSRNQLKKMIHRNKCELDFVVVATCHSEFVGRIFQQAGAKHVICIKNSEEVEDDAVITFTDQFYGMLFEQQMKICQAFEWAQNGVLLTHGEQQAEIFKLFVDQEDDCQNDPMLRSITDCSLLDVSPPRNSLHKCSIFGPFQKGKCRIDQPFEVQLKNTAPRVPRLKGRQKDMFKLIQKVLNPTSSRLYTLMGLPGVGKSSLISDTLGYISERSLLKGGSIFVNARGLSDCENLTRMINQQLIQENPTLFGNAKDKSQHRSQSFTVFNLILNKINIIDGNILLVIDNAEDLIARDKNDFKILISLILQRVPQLKVLLTSRIRLTPTAEFKEEIIILNSLTNLQSAVLFRSITRDINQKEINALIATQPDFDKYPNEKERWPCKKFHEHHLFTLLNGNPQSIILVAPLLADREKNLDLVRLYRKLTCDELYNLLKEEQIEDSMIASLRLSAQISIQLIKDSDPESMDLFLLLGMLPGGITPSDLNGLWKKVTEISKAHDKSIKNKQRKQISFEGNNTDSTFGGTVEHTWRRAFNELQKGKLVEEVEVSQGMGYKTQDETTPSQKSSIQRTSTLEESKTHTLIRMPMFVRNFSEGLIDDEKIAVFNFILADWFQNRLHGLFVTNQNLKYMNNQAMNDQSNIAEELEYLEQNLKAFIERMVDKHGEVLKVQEADATPDKNMLMPNQRESRRTDAYESESNSSISSEGVMVAELMFATPREQSKSTFVQKTPPSSGQIVREERKNTVKPVEPDERKASSQFLKQSSQQKRPHRDKANSMQRKPSYNWEELHKAYIANQELNERNEYKAQISNLQLLGSKTLRWESIKKTVQDAINGMKDGQRQDPRAATDPKERAYRWWRLAVDKIKKEYRAKKSIALNGVRRIGGGDDLDEIYDSGDEETATSTIDTGRVSEENLKPPSSQPNQPQQKLNGLQKRFRKAFLIRYMEHIQQIWQINTHRASSSNRRKQTTAVALLGNRKLSAMKYQGTLSNEEGTLIYYLANLIILDQHSFALSLIEKHYLRMKKCSDVFRGNVKRFQAQCTFHILQMHCEGGKTLSSKTKMQPAQYRDKQYLVENESQEVERQLRRAIKLFKKIRCDWGLGLTYFQMATFCLQKLKIEQRLQDELKGQVSRQNHVSMSNRRREQQKQREISVEEVNIQAGEFLQEAEQYFRNVNHLRGLALTFKHCYETATAGNDYKSNAVMAQEFNNKHIKYIHMFRKENDTNRDICISRAQGEDFSLLIEIVRSKKLQHPLFELVAEETITNSKSTANRPKVQVNVNQSQQWTPQGNLAPVFQMTTRAKQEGQLTSGRVPTDPDKQFQSDEDTDEYSDDSGDRSMNAGTIQIANLGEDNSQSNSANNSSRAIQIPLDNAETPGLDSQFGQRHYSGSFGQTAAQNQSTRREVIYKKQRESQ